MWLTSEDRPVSDIPPITPPERRENAGDWRDAVARRAEERRQQEEDAQGSAEQSGQNTQQDPYGQPGQQNPGYQYPGYPEHPDQQPPHGSEDDR